MRKKSKQIGLDLTARWYSIKQEVAGIYLVLRAADAKEAHAKLATLPYYPYMKIIIVALR